MKYYLLFIIIFCGLTFGIAYHASGSDVFDKNLKTYCQEEPFYFLNDIPPAIKLPGSIDLSFFKNRLVVFMYRFRLQIPDAIETAISRSLVVWSPWIKDDYAEIKIPRLDIEGGYKLIIEYKELENDETKRFELPFYVYRMNLSASSATSVEPQTTSPDVTNSRTVNENARSASERESTTASTRSERVTNAVGSPVNNRNGENRTRIRRDTVTVEKLRFDPSLINILASVNFEEKIEYANLLASFSEIPVPNINISEQYLDEEADSSDTDSDLYSQDSLTVSIDTRANYPLHEAIIADEKPTISTLIKQAADLNDLNNMQLSPLHLAVMTNNLETTRELISAGADINLKGNTGYTPLHIASELNYPDMAANLLLNGADFKIRTDQGFSSKDIARIQKNDVIFDLFKNQDSTKLELLDQDYSSSIVTKNLNLKNPDFKFSLPYDNKLVKQKNFSRILQIISVPVFAITAVSTTYLKSQANKNYSLSKTAETEELARYYYDRTTKYDTFSYLTGGISLSSVFGIIYSTIRKKSVNDQLYKMFF
jgi:ankyrin repeat protein